MFPNNKKRASRWLLTLTALVLAVAMLAGCGKKALVTYKDNGSITQKEFDNFLNVSGMLNPMYKQFLQDASLHQYLIKQLVGFKILADRADAESKKEADKMVTEQMDEIKTYLAAQEGGLDKQLKDNNIKLEDLENYIRMSFYAIGGIEKQVTDEQAKTEYDNALKETKNIFDVTTVRHILIAVKDETQQKDIRTFDQALARAKEVQAKLKAGGDFDALAKEYSDDPGSKDKGGKYENLDYQGMSGMVPEFAEAGFTLPVNQISEPVKTDYGYHIMRVDSRTTKTFDEMKQNIKSTLAQKKASDFIDNEVPGLIITNNVPTPTPAPSESPAPSASPEATPPASPAASPAATATPAATGK